MNGEFSCKGCEKRYPGCHAKCEKYQKEKAEHEKVREELNRQRDIQANIERQRCDRIYKASRERQYRSKYKRQ